MSNQTWQFYALLVSSAIEVIGIAIVGFGLFEMWEFGNNPFHASTLIPLGSLVIAIGGFVAAKVVKGLELREA